MPGSQKKRGRAKRGPKLLVYIYIYISKTPCGVTPPDPIQYATPVEILHAEIWMRMWVQVQAGCKDGADENHRHLVKNLTQILPKLIQTVPNPSPEWPGGTPRSRPPSRPPMIIKKNLAGTPFGARAGFWGTRFVVFFWDPPGGGF